MGLFDKKYCDICGQKIGLFGNRKLENGNLCKDCAKKLSPFFSERRNSTVEDIRRQLAYREENEKQLAAFFPSLTFDGSKKVYIDPMRERFVVTGLSNWRSGNPDLIAFSQVLGVDTDIQENKEEIYFEDSDGNKKSYVPPRYTCDYEFNITIPSKSLNEVVRSINEDEESIHIYVDSKKAQFIFDKTIIQTRLIDGTFPDVDRIIPTSH